MNIFFSVLIISSILYLAIISPNLILTSLIQGASNAINLSFGLIAIYSFWLSILKIMQEIGLNKIVYKIFRPITKLLFKNESDLTLEYITLNFSANLLGMGGAATPLGIKAIENMNKDDYLSDNMILFIVINATSIQLLPTTIISMRAKHLSSAPSDIILPSLIATTIATICGILLCYVFKGRKK